MFILDNNFKIIIFTILIILYFFVTIALFLYTYMNKKYIYKELIDMRHQINIVGLIILCIILFPIITPSQIIVFIVLCLKYIVEFIYFIFFFLFSKTRKDVKDWYKKRKQNRKWFYLFKIGD